MSAIRVRCNICGSVARVNSSKEVGGGLKQLYCSCQNVECGHTFVCDLTFSHTLSPSAKSLPERLRERVRKSSVQEQQKLFSAWAV